MLGRSAFSRTRGFHPENFGQHAVAVIGNVFFSVFVIGVLVFTIIAATYEPEDPLFHLSTKITNFLTSKSKATFKFDSTVVKTGEDFVATNQAVFANFLNETDVDKVVGSEITEATDEAGSSECDGTINCRDPEVFHLMMRTAIEKFKAIHFYKFGKPVRGSNSSTCDMAWRFRPKEGKTASIYKDYRRFVINRSENCMFSVVDIEEYHSGVNARKTKPKAALEKTAPKQDQIISLPAFGEFVNDSLPPVESEDSFSHGKYLIYVGGGDKCKSMDHYLWSFLCALGEAQYLKRTLIMDMKICLSSIYARSKQDEEDKDFRFYFDFERLKEMGSVLDQKQFWTDWNKWQKKDQLSLSLVEDFKITPMELADVKDTLIMRKFGFIEPDNYWYRVCEGKTEFFIQRPWHLLWKSKQLMDIMTAIKSRMNWDYDSLHSVSGGMAGNEEFTRNLNVDTSADALVLLFQDKIKDGRHLYIATNETETSFFDPLKAKYTTHFLDEYKDLWDENSEWYAETRKLNNGVPVEFDGYMR
ncbi:hypothetical protein L6164_028950 [Bauhinia variegata]|uniref:Uncharacterized protein n=1 Tax=Bauhinia variegata TaxID=167791 RepID=A0ACB9L927_BAUVA|nr:hypothetical protein L6164_028950 [Bauhinia variegata]